MTTRLVRVGMHECFTCERCACTFAVVHPACPRCSTEGRTRALAAVQFLGTLSAEDLADAVALLPPERQAVLRRFVLGEAI